MITLHAVVRAHKAVRDLWAVARIHVTEGDADGGVQPGTELAAKGDLLGAAAVGELLRLEGELVNDPKWGKQLHVERQESLGIQHEQEAHRWLERLAGVGPVLARRIYARFSKTSPDGAAGAGVLEVLREEVGPGRPDVLLEVEGIGQALAKTIRESWGQIGAQGDPETLVYLDALGLTRYEVNRVLAAAKKHRETPKVFLQTDPYRLTGEKGFGFARSDNVALRAGVSREAPARVDAAIEFQINETCAQDTVAPMAKLIDDVVKLTGVRRELVAEGVYRTARAGRGVVVSDEGQGVLVHPVKLLEAERTIHEWAVGPVASAKKTSDAAPGPEAAASAQAVAPAEGPGAAEDLDVEFDLTPEILDVLAAPGAPDPPTHVVIDVDPETAARLAGEVTRINDQDQKETHVPVTPIPPLCNCDAGWVPGQVEHDPWCATLNPPLLVPTEELLARADRQEIACELADVPMRVPAGGACPACARNVYEFVDGTVPLDACPNTDCKKGF